MSRQLPVFIFLAAFLGIILMWPSAEPAPIPPTEPISAPETSSKVVDGVTYVWIAEGSKNRILAENLALSGRVLSLESEADQKSTGLRDLAAEIDRLRKESGECQRLAKYWSERARDLSGGVDLGSVEEFKLWELVKEK